MIPGFTLDNCRSSIVEKLSPELRHQIDVAILENLCPTLQGLWLHFELGKQGVTYIAFYRYARRVRDRANMAELSDRAAEQTGDLDEKLQTLITSKVLDRFLNDDDIEPRDFKRLVSTLRLLARISAEKKKLGDDSRLAWARLDLDNKTHQLNADKLQLFRQRFLDSPDSLKLPIDQSANTHTHAEPQLAIIDQPDDTKLLAASSTLHRDKAFPRQKSGDPHCESFQTCDAVILEASTTRSSSSDTAEPKSPSTHKCSSPPRRSGSPDAPDSPAQTASTRRAAPVPSE
jgi:hypothetical protein